MHETKIASGLTNLVRVGMGLEANESEVRLHCRSGLVVVTVYPQGFGAGMTPDEARFLSDQLRKMAMQIEDQAEIEEETDA